MKCMQFVSFAVFSTFDTETLIMFRCFPNLVLQVTN